MLSRGRPGQRFDAPHAGRHRAFRDERDQPDLAGAVDVRAAAELDGIGLARLLARFRLAHRDDAHLVAVFLAEQRHGAGGDGAVAVHEMRLDRRILQHDGVRHLLDGREFRFRHRLRMREVEAQPFRRNQRALLRHVRAERLAERLVQKVRRRMVGADRRAPLAVDRQPHGVATREPPRLERADMDEEPVRLALRVGHAEARARLRLDHPGVADLAARLAVERRLVDHDRAALARFQRLGLGAVLDERKHGRFRHLGVVAEELGRAEPVAQRQPDAGSRRVAGAGPARASLGALPLHGVVERGEIDADAARFQRVLGQVERKAVGVVELERRLAVEDVAGPQRTGRFVEQDEAARQRPLEARFLQAHRLADQAFGAPELRIGVAHLAHQHRARACRSPARSRRADARGAWRGA